MFQISRFGSTSTVHLQNKILKKDFFFHFRKPYEPKEYENNNYKKEEYKKPEYDPKGKYDGQPMEH